MEAITNNLDFIYSVLYFIPEVESSLLHILLEQSEGNSVFPFFGIK